MENASSFKSNTRIFSILFYFIRIYLIVRIVLLAWWNFYLLIEISLDRRRQLVISLNTISILNIAIMYSNVAGIEEQKMLVIF